MYKDTLKISKHESAAAAQPDGPKVPSLPQHAGIIKKVNAICDAFLTVLQNRLDTNLQNLVTAHVCKEPPDLEAGLKLVANLRSKFLVILQCNTLVAKPTVAQNSEQAQDAIEHMCFLTDANRLYSHALGLYDLELTLLVAQQAQMVCCPTRTDQRVPGAKSFVGPQRVSSVPQEVAEAA